MDDFEVLLSNVAAELPVIEGPVESVTGYTALYRNGRIYLEKK